MNAATARNSSTIANTRCRFADGNERPATNKAGATVAPSPIPVRPEPTSVLASLEGTLSAKTRIPAARKPIPANGDENGAREMFSKAIETDPHCAEAANQLGLLAIRSHDSDKARQWFQRAIEAQPDHAGALNNLGVLFAQTGRYDDSVAVFRFGIERIPDDEPLNVNLARVYATEGQRDRAISILSGYLERNPDSTLAHRVLGQLTER